MSAATGPTPSMTRMGTTRNVTRDQATPTIAAAIEPTMPPRSEMARRTMPTVAEMTAQPRIAGRWRKRDPEAVAQGRVATLQADLAAPTSAALQKMTTV